MEPIRMPVSNQDYQPLKCLETLPPEIQLVIFSQLNDIGFQHASLVSENWKAETLTLVKKLKILDLKFFMRGITPHLDNKCKQSLEDILNETEILESANLLDLKYSINDFKREIVEILKNLDHKQFQNLEITYKNNEKKPYEDIFYLTRVYQEIDWRCGNRNIIMSLLDVEDLDQLFLSFDRICTENHQMVSFETFHLIMNEIKKKENFFKKILDLIESNLKDEEFSPCIKDLFTYLLNLKMNIYQTNRMIEITIKILNTDNEDLGKEILFLFEIICKLAYETKPDFVSTYPKFTTLLRELLDSEYSFAAQKIVDQYFHNSLQEKQKSEEIQTFKPAKKKTKCLIM